LNEERKFGQIIFVKNNSPHICIPSASRLKNRRKSRQFHPSTFFTGSNSSFNYQKETIEKANLILKFSFELNFNSGVIWHIYVAC